VGGQRAEELHLLRRGPAVLAHADGQRPEHFLIDHHRHDADTDHTAGPRPRDVARARIAGRVGNGQRLARRDDGADQALAHTHRLEAFGGRIDAGRRLDHDALAVLVEEPELCRTRSEELDRGVDDTLEHLVRRQGGREGLGEPAERLEAAALLAALRQQRHAGHHLADLMRDGLEQGQLVGVEGSRLFRDQRHDAPRLAVHRDRQRELRTVAVGAHALGDLGGQDPGSGQVGDHRPSCAHHLADVTAVERTVPQPVDVVGIEAAMGDQPEALRGAIVAKDPAEVDSRDVAHDLQRPLGGLHEIVTGSRRHHDRVEHLELAAAAPLRGVGGDRRRRWRRPGAVALQRAVLPTGSAAIPILAV